MFGMPFLIGNLRPVSGHSNSPKKFELKFNKIEKKKKKERKNEAV